MYTTTGMPVEDVVPARHSFPGLATHGPEHAEEVAPGDEPKRPTGQGEQAEAPTALKVPAGHVSGAVEPAGQTNPAAHTLQGERPVPEYVPPGHKPVTTDSENPVPTVRLLERNCKVRDAVVGWCTHQSKREGGGGSFDTRELKRAW